MTHLAVIAGVLSIVIGWIVTIRLFSLARRSRAVPERLLATGFGGLFCVGYPLAGASRAPGLSGTHEGALLFAIGAIGMAVGLIAFGRFPRIVFRPNARWAGWLAAAIGLSGVVAGVGCATIVAMGRTEADIVRDIQPWALLLMTSLSVALLWNGLESLHYYGIMKRRLALGLSRADTTHRFLLWAISSLVSVGPIAGVAFLRASGKPILAPFPMSIISAAALVTSACWWLAFFMPHGYRTWVLGEAPEPEASPPASD